MEAYDPMIDQVEKQLEFVKVKEPTLDIKGKRYYAVIAGSQNDTINVVTANSWDQSQASFSATSVTQQIVIDRKVMLVAQVRFQLTGPDLGKLLVQTGRDALKSFPLARSMNVLTAQVNSSSVSINMSDIIKGLEQYIGVSNLLQEFTNCPCYPDQSQQYSDLAGFVRNPLAGYGDGLFGAPEQRGAFPMVVNSLTNTAADITFFISEPLMVSPLHFESNLSPGFIGVDTLNVNINWKANLINSMWSRNENDGLFTTANVSFVSAPYLLLRQLTPSPLVIQDLPARAIYPYYQMRSFPLAQPILLSGATYQGQTNSIQLNVVPRRIFLYVDRDLNEERYDRPDAKLPISSVSLSFANRSGMLASDTQRSLYNRSKKNGNNLSWSMWSGSTTHNIVGTDVEINGIGGVLCLNIPEDVPLFNSDLLTSGSVVQTNLQITVTYTNVSASSITPRIVILTQTEGAFEIANGQSQTFLGLVTENDVLNAPYVAGIDYSDVQTLYGGNVFENIKNFISKIPAGIKKGLEFAEKDIIPIIKMIAPLLKTVGLGIEMEPSGGLVIGGRRISRDELKERYMENLRSMR
jgi:hypothetical protein